VRTSSAEKHISVYHHWFCNCRNKTKGQFVVLANKNHYYIEIADSWEQKTIVKQSSLDIIDVKLLPKAALCQ